MSGSRPASGRRPRMHCAEPPMSPQTARRKRAFSIGWRAFSRAMAAGTRLPLSTMKSSPRPILKRRSAVRTIQTLTSMMFSASESGPFYRVSYMYRAGTAYAAAGDEEAAIAHWREALNEEPASNAAYQSLIQLVNRNVPVDLFLRGEIDLFAQAYIPAISAFERFLEQSPQDARAGEAWFGIARAQMGMGQWAAARFVHRPAAGCLSRLRLFW